MVKLPVHLHLRYTLWAFITPQASPPPAGTPRSADFCVLSVERNGSPRSCQGKPSARARRRQGRDKLAPLVLTLNLYFRATFMSTSFLPEPGLASPPVSYITLLCPSPYRILGHPTHLLSYTIQDPGLPPSSWAIPSPHPLGSWVIPLVMLLGQKQSRISIFVWTDKI